ncbi:hypothetical protein GGH99_001559 [Coemansia sp. RSA 1285]|nr:hypothetical protein GGH99_001559 [Coemansia sp. RSA 1285]
MRNRLLLFTKAPCLGRGSFRRYHVTRLCSDKSNKSSGGGGGGTSWPTAESVILQRISSNGNSGASWTKTPKTSKELALVRQENSDSKEENEDNGNESNGKAGEEESSTSSSILSVSGIINSVRETRAATQKKGTAGDTFQRGKGRDAKEKRKNGDEEEDVDPPYAPFNTYRLVSRLVEAQYTRDQARTIMTLFKRQVHRSVEEVKANMLTKSDLENDAYLFRAALQELRTETQMIRKNDQAILESQLAAIDREIESLAQKINDEVSNVRSDIEIEMNNHKHDTNHAMKSLDMKLHELSSKYQFVVGEMKTSVEAIRLESIRHGLLAAVVTTLVLVAIVWAPDLIRQLRERDSQTRQRGSQLKKPGAGGGSGSSGAHEAGDGAMAERGMQDARRAAWAAAGTPSAGNGRSHEEAMQDLHALQTQGPNGGPSYRDHSFLNIQYDPTIFSTESQKNQNQNQNDGYDDWFDSYVNSSHEGDSDERNGKSASLMDSDSKLDSTFWRRRTQDDPHDINHQQQQQQSSDRESNSENTSPQIPLHFTYDNDDSANNSQNKD